MVSLVATVAVFGLCLVGMAVGLIVRGKLLCKDCGLDPATGERVGHCACSHNTEESGSSPTHEVESKSR